MPSRVSTGGGPTLPICPAMKKKPHVSDILDAFRNGQARLTKTLKDVFDYELMPKLMAIRASGLEWR